MMRTLRSLFLARLLREKILLVAFVLVVDILWLSSLAGRAGHFLAEERHTTSALAEQSRWLANRAAVDKAGQLAARAFQPEQTLDSTRLLAAIQDIANNCGLHNFNTAPPEDVPSNGLATVHTLQFTVNKVDYESLRAFCSALQRRAPYIGVEQMTVVADKANPALLGATMKISSVEILR
ncbi:MAG: hypothetical protein ABSA05_13685 [Opitutaceae bacterium]|jgi:hypothetical protein